MSVVARDRSSSRFTDRVFDLLENVDYRPAITEEERDAIFRLRYEAYLREGAIKPDFSQRLSDRFDDLENTWIFGVYVDGELAGSMRLHVTADDYPDMPAAGIFADHLDHQIALGKTIVDPTRFVVDADMARIHPELPYVTTRIGWMAGEYFGADMILATVRREHQAFYRRIFGHEVVADARPYYTLTKPLSLMVLDYPAVKERVHHRFPFFRSSYFERRALFEAPGLPEHWSAENRRFAQSAPPTADTAPALKAGGWSNGQPMALMDASK